MGLEQKDEKLYFVICDVHKIAMYDKIWGIWVVSKNNRVTKSYQELLYKQGQRATVKAQALF